MTNKNFSDVQRWVSTRINTRSFEGTTTLGLKSDIDMVMVPEGFPVVTNLAEAQQHFQCLLLVQDSHTPAGYCKLRCVSQGVPMTRATAPECCTSIFPSDAEGRLFLLYFVPLSSGQNDMDQQRR